MSYLVRRVVSCRNLYYVVIALAIMAGLSGLAQAQCSSPANAVVAENCLTGTPDSEWDVSTGDAGDPTIQGFATDISVNQGSTVFFKIKTPASAYSIKIYRLGYYGGLGARKVATISPSVTLPQSQPACVTDSTTGLSDCGNWQVSASWTVPATATSGVYIAHLVRSDTGGDSHIVFIVRNDSSHSAILYQTADETWQAYNNYGSGSFYAQNTPVWDLTNRSFKVSYNRPIVTRGFEQEWDTWIFGPEYPMIQWLEQNGYDVTYFTGVDATRSGTLIKNHKIYMDSGHDEYWSGPHRSSVEAARDAGVNLAFFTGNGVFWKTRFENSIDGTNTPNRTLVCYKETLAATKLDPSDPPTWTGTWRDPTFSPPADGGKPENALTGTLFMVNGTGPDNDGSLTMKVPADDGKMRFWRNTAIASQAPNTSHTLPTGSLGYEWDIDADNGFRPAGAFHLSTTTYPLTTDLLLDYGASYGAGTATHHMMLYRAPSGALVFNSGTINWSWGLSSNHDNYWPYTTPAPDVNMQQATVNLFADMGVQPATLQSGIVAASASTDSVPPISTITSPSANASLSTGSSLTVSGTASDSGGVVGGVEVSVDGGATWHPAAGRGTWTYLWTPTVTGSVTVMSRGVDDSGNLETPHAGVTVSVQPQTCPCTIWNASRTPVAADSGDSNAVEVGVKFRTDSDGSILGVRFYKSAANTGSHVGHLWSGSGTLLGTATFSGESATGWQQASFPSPIQVTANTTYVISYFAPKGHYAADSYSFTQAGVDNPPLHALANGVDGQDGVFVYAPSGGFPTSGYLAANYWVDTVFTSSNVYHISGTISGYGGAGATLNVSGTESFTTTSDASGNFDFPGIINGTYTVTPNNPGVTFTPTSKSVTINNLGATGINFAAVVTQPLSISGTIAGGAGTNVTLGGAGSATTTTNASGNYSFTGLLNGTYTVTPQANGYLFTPGTQSVVLSGANATGVNFTGQLCNCSSIWQPSTVPAVVDSNDANAIEVGVKFRTDVLGYVTGLRFYKASTNVGAHVGHIYSSAGVLLGTANFSSEMASGWQQVSFPAPILVYPNTTYVASYFAPSGHYSASSNYFATTGADAAPLHALANGVDGPNGVYLYSASGGFPNNTFSSTNYWIDLLFAPSQSYSLSGLLTGTGSVGATVLLSGPSAASTTADGSGNYLFNGVFPGTYSITPNATGVVFSPGTQNVAVGNANVTGINFAVPSICPCETIWQSSAIPPVLDSGDALPYELGVKFRADFDGYVLGVRFYKGANNTGSHVGNLWSTGGSRLGSASFAVESQSGWQQALFGTPVPVSANTTYIASYFAPAGHYSLSSGIFGSAGVDAPPLHALANGVDGPNGVYSQSSASAYPNSSFSASNYWVDVIYATTTTHSIAGSIAGVGAEGATVTLGGTATGTATTDTNGSYIFSGLVDGTYTVTPSRTGYVFTPGSQTINLNGAHNLAVNFSSSLQGYPVSGTVTSGPGVTITAVGTATYTTTTDASGNYTFPALPNGNYTVSASGVGYSISPASQSITVSGASLSGINFTATVLSYSISGTIPGGAGTTVTLTGSVSLSTVVDASGNFSFPGMTGGSYVIVPAKPGLVFVPASYTAVVAGANVSGVNFTIPTICPCNTIWQPATLPVVVDSGDNQSIEVGVKFRTDSAGYIAGIRFYKGATNTGTHQGNLWSSTGALLGNATFTSEGASGWQQVFFATPIAVTANTTYIASYFAPAGHYSSSSAFFASSGVDVPPLHALANGIDDLNGIYSYGATSTSPVNSYNATNYWVDVIFTTVSQFNIAGTITGPGGPGATVSLSGAASATTVADASGAYSFAGVLNGAYTVSPSNSGYAFTPASQPAVVNGANVTANFSSAVQTFTISGTISGAGGSGATVTLTGASTVTTAANASGVYSFTGVANGAYTVTPTQPGYLFTPASAGVTVSGANATANFSSVAQTFTISGTISGAGGSGATVNLTGAATATVTANASGVYSFTGVANGNYTVTPTKAGYVFTPLSAAVTVNGANATANFSSAPTFTISGTISGAGGSGATVNLTGTATATVTANASGVYSFSGVVSGAYTVTPTKAGYVFTPPSTAVTVNGANVTANFSSAVQTFTISGTISGAGGSGATVQLTGAATATVTANASGVYSFPAVVNGAYTVTPTKTGYAFTPANRAVTVSGANTTANFTSAQTFTISGTISGAGGSGATVQLTGAATATVTANASGVYSFPAVVNGAYTVAPTKAGYVFTPANRAVTVSGANTTANFTSAQTFTISGTISGAGGSGATVNLTGAATATVTANASGVYSFPAVVNGAYTVTPTKTGYAFTPANRAVTVSGANTTANFTSAQTFTITGTITGGGAAGATVQLTGAASATVTANASGVYSFTGVVNGAYTVTPSRVGYVFTPTNRAVTVNGANTTANFTSAVQTFTISGTISGGGGSGATVKLTGAATATVTANTSGFYSFTGVVNGAYTVTPTKSGHLVLPQSQNVTVNGANATVNFFSL